MHTYTHIFSQNWRLASHTDIENMNVVSMKGAILILQDSPNKYKSNLLAIVYLIRDQVR